jgi:predicted Zn-dependent protease
MPNVVEKFTISRRRIRKQLWAVLRTDSVVVLLVVPTFPQKSSKPFSKIEHSSGAAGSSISQEKENKVGKRFAARYESTTEFVGDPWIAHYLAGQTEKVAANSDWQDPATVKVVRTSDIDLFSLPGGCIYLDSGFLLSADSEDEIAGAIAH